MCEVTAVWGHLVQAQSRQLGQRGLERHGQGKGFPPPGPLSRQAGRRQRTLREGGSAAAAS